MRPWVVERKPTAPSSRPTHASGPNHHSTANGSA